MPSRYRIDDSQQTVWTASEGHLTDQDLLGMYRQMSADDGFRPEYKELCDFSDVSAVNLSPDTVRRLALESPFADGTRHAIVAPGPVVFGLARMYQAYVESGGGDRVGVFTDLHAAADWLGVDLETR